jgi:hypothetical protein
MVSLETLTNIVILVIGIVIFAAGVWSGRRIERIVKS